MQHKNFKLSDDIWQFVCTFLTVPEWNILSQCSTRMYKLIFKTQFLWQQACKAQQFSSPFFAPRIPHVQQFQYHLRMKKISPTSIALPNKKQLYFAPNIAQEAVATFCVPQDAEKIEVVFVDNATLLYVVMNGEPVKIQHVNFHQSYLPGYKQRTRCTYTGTHLFTFEQVVHQFDIEYYHKYQNPSFQMPELQFTDETYNVLDVQATECYILLEDAQTNETRDDLRLPMNHIGAQIAHAFDQNVENLQVQVLTCFNVQIIFAMVK